MRPVPTVLLLCLAEALSMSAFSTYPALLSVIRQDWQLSNAAAGFLSGVYLGGYTIAVPVLTTLTDRADARRIYAGSAMLSAAGALGFALAGRGFWSAVGWQTLGGMGVAGTYMPGLKILADRVVGRYQSRAVAFYTSTFGIGTSLSLWLAGVVSAAGGWRWAFGVAAIGPALAGLLVIGFVPRGLGAAGPAGATFASDARRLRHVLRNRQVARYVAGYAAHCWELFGFRSWIVAFFTFAASRPGIGTALVAPATAAAAINLLGPAASILGNEGALQVGRARWIARTMVASSTLACLLGFASHLPWPAMVGAAAVYFLAVMADSAALTAGVVAEAHPADRGATMGVYSLAGFAAASLAPLVYGGVLDFAGGAANEFAWVLAFASLAAPSAILLPGSFRWRVSRRRSADSR